jgi:CBS domain-containing protein
MAEPSVPSSSLMQALDGELAAVPPFAQMTAAQRRRFVEAARQSYHAPGETVLDPSHGPVRQLHLVRRGSVAAPDGGSCVAGELFPLAELLQGTAVAAPWRAEADTFCLVVDAEVVHALAAESPPFADFVHRHVLHWLEASSRRLQAAYAEQALAEQTLALPLARFVRPTPPLALPPSAPLEEALGEMQRRGVGSVLVVDDAGAGLGILTRHDLLERVVLARRALDTPLSAVMSTPLQALDVRRSAHDAALLMSTRGLRHVAITDAGRVVGIVSERDLFALQRLSLRQVAQALQQAGDRDGLARAAADIRRLAAQLYAQGVGARHLTELITRLNDTLTERLLHLVATEHGLDLQRACWLAFGSEGRGEQTIATDQDNGLVFAGDAAERAGWLAFGRDVNRALDAMGYPLCKGGIMAGEPACCLTADEWLARFEHWIAHGAPADLLQASIFFDLRPLAGNAELAAPLQRLVATRPRATPRFLKQLAVNALQQRPPLRWLGGGIAGSSVDGRSVIDLKLQGTGLFVEAARILALASGVCATGTRERLLEAGAALQVPDDERQGWVAAFEHLQLLRLNVQLGAAPGAPAGAANVCRLDTLNPLDSRLLRETLRVAQGLQQRVELDWAR